VYYYYLFLIIHCMRVALHHVLSKPLSLFLVIALVIVSIFPVSPAEAAALTGLSDTMSSLSISATSSHTMRFTTPTGASSTGQTIVITFPASYDFTGKATTSVTFTHGASTGLETTETLAGVPSATAWGIAFSGTANRIMTLTAPSDGVGAAVVAPNDKVIITYSSASSTNPTSAGSYTATIVTSPGDTGDLTNVILNNNQVNISGTVPQSITFTISTTTISFGTLSAVAARFASSTGSGDGSEVEAHNIVAGTNAANGYTITASGTTLTYGNATINPIGGSNTLVATGTEQFGLRATAAGGIGAVSAPYAASGFAYATSSFPSAVATASGASANTTYSVRYLANITSNTEAGVYTANVSYIATSNF
jgi:hypothetical protein